MRRSLTTVTLVAVALLVVATVALAAPPAQPRNFTAPLSGAEEVPSVDTRARGVGIFHLSADGTELSYRLIASNIENVMMAHIHCCAGPGANAGVAVWLYPEDGPPPEVIEGRHSGTLATGTITSADLVGDFAGMSLADLVDEIIAGNAYVNVHTTQNPGGEIRGQLP
jgi:CHRD domain